MDTAIRATEFIICWPLPRTRKETTNAIIGATRALLKFWDDRERVKDVPALREWNELNIARTMKHLGELNAELERLP